MAKFEETNIKLDVKQKGSYLEQTTGKELSALDSCIARLKNLILDLEVFIDSDKDREFAVVVFGI